MTTPDSAPAGAPAWAGSLPGWPTFARELTGTLAARSQYVLQGNSRDLYLVPGADPAAAPRTLTLPELLWGALRPSNYQCLITYDPVHGIGVYPSGPEPIAQAKRLLGPKAIGSAPALPRLRPYLAEVAGVAPPKIGAQVRNRVAGAAHRHQQDQPPAEPQPGDANDDQVPGWAGNPSRPRAAFLIDYAARITKSPGNLDPDEHDFFLFCLKLAHSAERCAGGPPGRPQNLFNPIIWLVDGERDLPAWLTAGNERIRTIAIPLPDLEARTTMARRLAGNFGVTEPTPEQRRVIGRFAAQTHGLTLQAMKEVTRLAIERQMPFDAITDAVRIYKLGVEDNPWRRASVKQRVIAGEKQITSTDLAQENNGVSVNARVVGQDHAVRKTLDILKRAALGLSGAQASSSGSRPRGVIFFAGPTGVGKTELAKATAELLFGQTDSFLRFDMSEFAAEHSDQRLVGAPPGYVGFEAGGELTSAVRAQPFRVVLFDEIEKANRLVLDKFLQILEDGRLTDGHGVTTYFSECVLIFTSNLGIMVKESPGSNKRVAIVHRGEPYPEIESKVRSAIKEHFTNEIGRPELLNRFGDNIVVFNFISDEAARQIFDLQVENIIRRVSTEQQITLRLAPDARTQLLKICTANLDNGGRGIGNMLESALINPLGRALFDAELAPGSTVAVVEAGQDGTDYTLTLSASDPRKTSS
jgi:AAA domain (Cdc48 subfamily)/C-terminal, D2-small domain, of ClpB protein